LIIPVLTCLAAGATLADQQDGQDRDAEPAVRSLDDLLLDDLDNELLKGLGNKAAEGQGLPPGQDVVRPEPSGLDRRLLEQLGQGEDLGNEKSDPFLQIGEQMRTVEELISRRDTSEKTQRMQQQIVDDIEKLIDEMKKKCAGGQCNSSSQSSSSQNNDPKSVSKAGSGENRGGSKPARDSELRVGRSDESDARVAQVMDMLKQVWGHLPPRVREQMQSGMAEEFLPKYERLIEQYYQRLAEERGAR